jgi:hypothetical protein
VSDNITVTSGTGVTIAADDDGSALHQLVKIEFGDNNSFNTVTTATGLPVQVLSLPNFAAGASVRITSLPAFAVGSSVTISNLATIPLTISGTTIAITSLPNLGLGSTVAITSLPAFAVGSSVTISNLSTVPLTVSGTTIAITSLPDLGLNSYVKISSLPGIVIISATNAVPVNVVAGGAGNGSILDGVNTAIKATVASYTNASPLLVRLSDVTGAYVGAGAGTQYNDGDARGTATGTLSLGDDGTSLQSLHVDTAGNLQVVVLSMPAISVTAASSITVSNLSTVPLTVSGTTIAITSLPNFAVGSSVTISNLATVPLTISGTTIAITSLPNLGLGSTVAITSLPNLGAGSFVKITSLPAFAVGSSVTISNLSTVPLTVSGTTIAITSLPALGTSTATIGAIKDAGINYTQVDNFKLITNTNSVVLWTPSVGLRYVLTDFIFNVSTETTLTLQESGTTAYTTIAQFFFAQRGGVTSNLQSPIKAHQTNTPLLVTIANTSGTAFVNGYEEA